MKEKFDVIGMNCSACSSSVEKAVSNLKGVKSVNVNLLANSMVVEFDGIEVNDIINCVENDGFKANIKNKEQKIEEIDYLKIQKQKLILSFCFLIPLLYISMGEMLKFPLGNLNAHKYPQNFAFTQFLLLIPITYLNQNYFINGFKSLFKKHPNMDSLIAVGSSAAILYGIYNIYLMGTTMDHKTLNKLAMSLYFESAGVILTLISLGKYLETKSKAKTKEAITKLLDLSPKTVLIEKNGKEQSIGIEEVKIDDIIIIKQGNRIPVDGEIIYGNGVVDESFLTGESMPINKEIGSSVISATINTNGFFKFKATKVGNDTTLAKIIELIEEASSSKAPIAKLADQISRIFVPIVLGISLSTFIIWLLLGASFNFSLSIAISILVISCPCALGLATPVAIMVGTGLGASNGILIKSAAALEVTHKVNTIVLDKTGTITDGKLTINKIISSINENEFLRIAASLEKHSDHPIAQTIALSIDDYFKVSDFIEFSGLGIKGVINDKVYFAGNVLFLEQNNINFLDFKNKGIEFAKLAMTPIFFANEKEVIGIIALIDNIKESSYTAIKAFQKMNLDVIMLTGDNVLTANAIKDKLGIKQVFAEVLPHEKEEKIRELQSKNKIVAMVGDGINDAPALMRANIGIAIGAGSDIAIEAADIVLISSNLNNVVNAINISNRVVLNIKQNLFWAFFYNVIGIPLAAGVLYHNFGILLNPMFAAAAMSLSSVSVVLNALRLKKTRRN